METETADQRAHELVEQYLSFADSVGKSMRALVPTNIDMDEILSLSRFGLLEAARRFDASRRVSFKTFAYYRIRGAVFDGVRSQGLRTRSESARIKFLRGMDLLMQQRTEASSAGPPARHLDVVGFRDLIGSMASVYVLSLDGFPEGSKLPAASGDSPHEAVEKSEAARTVCRVLKNLSEQEGKVIRGYYYDDKTLEEIGGDLGLSRSWVCRIHAQALKKLKKMLSREQMVVRQTIRA